MIVVTGFGVMLFTFSSTPDPTRPAWCRQAYAAFGDEHRHVAAAEGRRIAGVDEVITKRFVLQLDHLELRRGRLGAGACGA
jgi:hypothetical protein